MAGLLTADGGVSDNAKISSPSKRKSKVDSSSLEAQAAASLALLLREDPLLTKHNMHLNVSSNDGKGDAEANAETDGETDSDNTSESQASFAYAAALLLENKNAGRSVRDHQQQAEDALGEVDRKLALVESLAERVSRLRGVVERRA